MDPESRHFSDHVLSVVIKKFKKKMKLVKISMFTNVNIQILFSDYFMSNLTKVIIRNPYIIVLRKRIKIKLKSKPPCTRLNEILI